MRHVLRESPSSRANSVSWEAADTRRSGVTGQKDNSPSDNAAPVSLDPSSAFRPGFLRYARMLTLSTRHHGRDTESPCGDGQELSWPEPLTASPELGRIARKAIKEKSLDNFSRAQAIFLQRLITVSSSSGLQSLP